MTEPQKEYIITEDDNNKICEAYKLLKDIQFRPYTSAEKVLDELIKYCEHRKEELFQHYERSKSPADYVAMGVWERRSGILEVLDKYEELREREQK